MARSLLALSLLCILFAAIFHAFCKVDVHTYRDGSQRIVWELKGAN